MRRQFLSRTWRMDPLHRPAVVLTLSSPPLAAKSIEEAVEAEVPLVVW